jgi:hypothetical protein
VTIDNAPGLRLRFTTPITHFQAEKTALLRPGSAVLEIRYKLTNQGRDALPFLF